MSAPAAKQAYSPRILQPRLHRPMPGVRVFLIQSERDQNVFHFIGIFPTGHIRCSCEAAKHGRQCHHKLALCQYIEREQVDEPMLADLSPRDLLDGFNRRRQVNKLPLMQQASRVVPVIHRSFQKKLDATIFPTVAAKREAAVLVNHTPEEFSIYR